MRDTGLTCECCGERESYDGCVRGRVMCPCETRNDYIHAVDLCPNCDKCEVHCKCRPSRCQCRELSTSRNIDFFGHHRDCTARKMAHYRIAYQKAKEEMETAEMMLKTFDIQRTSESETETIRTTEGDREEI